MSKIEEIINAVKLTYKNTTATRFISDEHGNVFWMGGREISDKTSILFPEGPPMNRLEEKYSTVLIDNKPCCVRGTVLSYDGDGIILWTVYSMKNILNELGSTDNYVEFCYITSDVKRNVERILYENEESIARDPRRRNSIPIINQNKACFSLLRQVESLNALFTVIFKRNINNTTINIIDFLDEMAKSCTKELKEKAYNIVVNSETLDHDGALIKANHFYLQLTLMTLIDKLLSCSRMKDHAINITFDGYRFVISLAFEHDMCQYIDQIYSDFPVYCAKMYIRHIGGSVSEKDNRLIVTLPQYLPTAFHSSGIELQYEEVRYKYLMEMFLYDILYKDKGTDNMDKSIRYLR